MEKVHREVSNMLLQVLNDGRLTDGQGRTVEFTNTIIVMSSNIGAQPILEISERGQPDEIIAAHVRTLLRKHLRLGLLNRIDKTVALPELCKKDLVGIVEIQVGSLRKRLKALGLDLKLTPAAVNALADEGYDPAFGARPLKRVIQQRLENSIAGKILEGV
jgi:ATP-dependent Clp protease ATP-binding subunit ClpB